MPLQVIFVSAAILLIAAAPLPYGLYMLVRIVATLVFGWAGIIAVQRENIVLATLYGLTAILFNPFLKIHLDKEIWMVIDVLAAVLLLATARKIKD